MTALKVRDVVRHQDSPDDVGNASIIVRVREDGAVDLVAASGAGDSYGDPELIENVRLLGDLIPTQVEPDSKVRRYAEEVIEG